MGETTQDTRNLYEILGLKLFTGHKDIIEHFSEIANVFYAKDRDSRISWENEAAIHQAVWDEDIAEFEFDLYAGSIIDRDRRERTIRSIRLHAYKLLTDPVYKREYDRTLPGGEDLPRLWSAPRYNEETHHDLDFSEMTQGDDRFRLPNGISASYVNRAELNRIATPENIHSFSEEMTYVRDPRNALPLSDNRRQVKNIVLGSTVGVSALLSIINWSSIVVVLLALFVGRQWRRHIQYNSPTISNYHSEDVPVIYVDKFRHPGRTNQFGKVLLTVLFLVLIFFAGALLSFGIGESGNHSSFIWGIFAAVVVNPVLGMTAFVTGATLVSRTFGPATQLTKPGISLRNIYPSSEELLNTLIYGEPGAGLVNAASVFEQANIDDGIKGEKATSAQLFLVWTFLRRALLFNSLRVPGLRSADIDHLLLVDDRALILDSKLWSPGYHTLCDGVVVSTYFAKGGNSRSYTHSIMDYAASTLRKELSHSETRVTVDPYIVAHCRESSAPFALINMITEESTSDVTLCDVGNVVHSAVGVAYESLEKVRSASSEMNFGNDSRPFNFIDAEVVSRIVHLMK